MIASVVFAALIAGGVTPAVAEVVAEPDPVVAEAQAQPTDESVEQEIAPEDERAVSEEAPDAPEGEATEQEDTEPAAERLVPFAADLPQLTLAQSELSVTKAASLNGGEGLSVGVGQHPEPGEYRILVDGEESARGLPSGTGQLVWRTLPQASGTYQVTVEAPSTERSEPVTLTIVADPTVRAPGFTNDRIVRYRGYLVEAEGFAAGEQVTVTALDGTVYTHAAVDGSGVLSFAINARTDATALGALPTLVLESPTRKVEQVVPRRDPSFEVPERVSALDLFFGDVVISGENLPEDFTIWLQIDGEDVDPAKVVNGQVEFWVPGYLEVGEHEVRLYDHVGTLHESTLEVVDAELESDLTSNITGRWLDRATHAQHGFGLRIEGIEPGSFGILALLDAEGAPVAITDAEAAEDGAVDLEVPGEFFEEIEAGDYTLEALFFADTPMLMAVAPMASPQVQFLSDDFVLTDLSVTAPKTVTQQQLTDGVFVDGMGFQPGEPVTIVVNDLIAGERLAGADTSVALGLPALIPAGEVEILLVSEAGYVGTTVTVVDEPVAPGADDEPAAAVKPPAVRGRLPATGADAFGGLLASALLLMLGGAAVISRQRRRA